MPAQFDVFLSHATSDKPLVEELARRLTRENLRPWLDILDLQAGDSWQPEIEAVLATCAACLVIIGPGGFGPWQHEEMRLAIRRRVEDREHRFQVITVLLPGVEQSEWRKLPGFLTATNGVKFRDTLDEPEAFRRLVCGIRGIKYRDGFDPVIVGETPYRGLELFDVEHAPLFFGREALIEWLLDALKRKSSAVENRFLAIVGASGSGKSSLARAGLLAALKDGKIEGSEAWPRAICRPGAEPFLNLANALTGLAAESVSVVVYDRLKDRKDGEQSLHCATGLVLSKLPQAMRLVVLVDQFEEVFTLCRNEAERRDFLATLLHAATVSGGRTVVVLAMRADFYHRCAAHADLAGALSDHRVLLVGPMTDDELRRVIDRPARLAGLEPEPGLVELLVDDLRGRVGALPLLQFALQEVWRRREDYRLTIRTYRDIGGLEGALQRKADEVYDQFTPEQQEICRRVFLSLIQPGERSEDTRRRALLSELVPPDTTQAAPVQAIISRLAAPEARLLTTERRSTDSGDGTLEVAHEALIRGWPRLRTWIESDRAGLRTRNRLNEAAREWADAPEEAKESMLYSGARLAVATEWAASHCDDLGTLAAAFLAASQEQECQKKADEAERNRRLAEAEHQRAEEAEAATLRQKKLSQWLLGAAVVGVLLALAAVLQTWRANSANKLAITKANQAKSRQLAALSTAERSRHLDRSLLLAVEALRTDNTFEARDGLFKALQERPELGTFLHNNEGGVSSVAFSPDGKTLAAGFRGGGGVVLWDPAGRNRLGVLPLDVKEGYVQSVAFSPDGNTLAAGYNVVDVVGGGVVQWDRAGRNWLGAQPLPVKEGWVSSVAFSPDGNTLAAGYDSGGSYGGVALWDRAGRNRLGKHPLPVQEGGVSSVAFSPDGKTLAAGYDRNGGGVALWDLAGRDPLGEQPLPVKEGGVSSVAFSPDGKTLAAGYRVIGGSDGGVVLWDPAGRNRLGKHPLPVQEGGVSSVAFSPDGKTLAAGYNVVDVVGGGVALWDLAGRNRLGEKPLPVKEGGVSSVAFSPDGKTLAAGYDSGGGYGGVALWDLTGRNQLREQLFTVNGGWVSSIAFSPDGNTLAAGYRDIVGGGVALWDRAGPNRLVNEPLPVKEGWVSSVAFSPDGKLLAAGHQSSGGGGVVMWDRAGRKRLGEKPLPVKEGGVSSIAFSPDGKTIAAGYNSGDGGVVLWDRAVRNRVVDEPLAVKEGWVSSVAFSPDGKTLAAGYNSGGTVNGVVLWDVAGRMRLGEQPLPVKEGAVSSVAFSPDGKLLTAGYGYRVVGGGDGGVVLWDLAGRNRLREQPLPVKEGGVSSVAFSPDGKLLTAGFSSDSTVNGVVLWDVAGRNRLVAELLAVKDRPVLSVAFRPDNRTIAVGCGYVLLCDVDLESWKRLAGRIANRNFTRDEWRQHFPGEGYRATFPDLPVPPEVPLQ